LLLLLLLLLLRTCSRLRGQTPDVERRREGDTLYVQCPYTGISASNTKFWCRLTDGACEELARSYSQRWRPPEDGRITIKDDTTNKTLSITMTGLRAEDSGTYFCAYYTTRHVLRTISLNVFRAHIPGVFQGPSSTQPRSQATSLSNENPFLILSVVLLILLILALITSVTLCVRYSRLLGRTGNREAEDTSDRAEGTAQPGSTGRRESSQDDSKGPAYINLDMHSYPSPEDPLYCNVEPSQALRNPQNVEYAVITFNQSPRNDRE
ncbi:TRML1 protein, partial [Machaerirhynchus nigripectus]|nr:TRML1 protein [Machaerirhynchus nigripectus]